MSRPHEKSTGTNEPGYRRSANNNQMLWDTADYIAIWVSKRSDCEGPVTPDIGWEWTGITTPKCIHRSGKECKISKSLPTEQKPCRDILSIQGGRKKKLKPTEHPASNRNI